MSARVRAAASDGRRKWSVHLECVVKVETGHQGPAFILTCLPVSVLSVVSHIRILRLSLSSRVCLSLISLSLPLSGSLFFLLSFLSPLTLHSILSSSLLSLSLSSPLLYSLPLSLSSVPLSVLSSLPISPFSSVFKVECIFTCIFIKSDLQKKYLSKEIDVSISPFEHNLSSSLLWHSQYQFHEGS